MGGLSAGGRCAPARAKVRVLGGHLGAPAEGPRLGLLSAARVFLRAKRRNERIHNKKYTSVFFCVCLTAHGQRHALAQQHLQLLLHALWRGSVNFTPTVSGTACGTFSHSATASASACGSASACACGSGTTTPTASFPYRL